MKHLLLALTLCVGLAFNAGAQPGPGPGPGPTPVLPIATTTLPGIVMPDAHVRFR